MKGYGCLILVLCLTGAFAMAVRQRRSFEDWNDYREHSERALRDEIVEKLDEYLAQRQEIKGCNRDNPCPPGLTCVLTGPRIRTCIVRY